MQDYQMDVDNARRRIHQHHMVQWIVDGVIKGITPQQVSYFCLTVLSLWFIGSVHAEPETVIGRAWVQSPDAAENCFRITGVHALRLLSRTGKRV